MSIVNQIPRYLLVGHTPIAIERDRSGAVAVFVWNSMNNALERLDASVLALLGGVDVPADSRSAAPDIWEITREIFDAMVARLFAGEPGEVASVASDQEFSAPKRQ